MKISAIVAMSWPNAIIGQYGQLPWKLPEDMRRFREITMNYPVIMGRKTYESIGKPLVGRMNIVVTRNQMFQPYLGLVPAFSFDDALDYALNIRDQVFVIGGAEIYKQALPLCDEVLVTRVNAPHLETGTRFEGDFSHLKVASCEWVYKDAENEYDMRFERWVRC